MGNSVGNTDNLILKSLANTIKNTKISDTGSEMSAVKRNKTKYPNVYYIIGKDGQGSPEKVFYIRYRKEGKQVEEKVGRQFKNAMTEAKANNILSDK